MRYKEYFKERYYKFGEKVKLLTDEYEWLGVPKGCSGVIEGSCFYQYGFGTKDAYQVRFYKNYKYINTIAWVLHKDLELRK